MLNIVNLGSGYIAMFHAPYDITVFNIMTGKREILPIETNKGLFNLAHVMGVSLQGINKKRVLDFLGYFRGI